MNNCEFVSVYLVIKVKGHTGAFSAILQCNYCIAGVFANCANVSEIWYSFTFDVSTKTSASLFCVRLLLGNLSIGNKSTRRMKKAQFL